MAIEFAKAVGLITAITSTAKGLLNAREEAKINEIAIHLQGIVLDLQSEMMMIQSDYQKILRSRDELEKKLSEQENWDKERAKYTLKNVGFSWWHNTVYVFNHSEHTAEPPHWICPNCYEDKKKSILQDIQDHTYWCPRCKSKFQIGGQP